MSSGIGTDDMSWAAFTNNSFRVLATEIWFDMILSFYESIIARSFRSLLFDKKLFYVGPLDLGPPAHLSEKYCLIDCRFSFVQRFLCIR